MMARATVTLALVLSAWGSVSARDAVSDDAIAALAMPEAQFRAILPAVLFRTQTLGMSVYSLGIPESCAVVRPAFDKAVASHLPAWRANIIKAYRDNVPAEMLAKATSEGSAGRAVLRPYLDRIGGQMQSASTPILNAAAAEVLMPVMEAAAKIDIKTVDGAKRQQEMAAAKADGSLFCGLQGTRREMK